MKEIKRGKVRHGRESPVLLAKGATDPGRWFEVARCGKYADWRYGAFDVTPELLAKIAGNFEAGLPGSRIPLDENHDPDHKACAWVKALRLADGGQALEAQFEDWTPEAQKWLEDGVYRYFSISFGPFDRPDMLGGVETVQCVLDSIALTNQPVLVEMEGMFSSVERIEEIAEKAAKSAREEPGAKQDDPRMKDALKKLAEKILARAKVTAGDVESFKTMLEAAPEADRAEFAQSVKDIEAKCAATVEAEAVELAKQPKPEEVADLKTRLSKLEGEKVELAKKAAVESLLLSADRPKGFPAAKKAEAEKLVADVGVEAAAKFAAALEHVTVMPKDATVQTGTTEKDADLAAKLKLAKEDAVKLAEKEGIALHVALARIYSERDLGSAQ